MGYVEIRVTTQCKQNENIKFKQKQNVITRAWQRLIHLKNIKICLLEEINNDDEEKQSTQLHDIEMIDFSWFDNMCQLE